MFSESTSTNCNHMLLNQSSAVLYKTIMMFQGRHRLKMHENGSNPEYRTPWEACIWRN